ncbi:MAG: hypothetical protein K2M31_08555 [Muribaculaceae bacterium]|nr:hypothetical protein [Muribaculaceae bacterium]
MSTSGKRKSAEKALEEFLIEYVNSGQLDADLAQLPASQRIQAVTRLLPYCLTKAKEPDEEQSASRTGNESLAIFFSRINVQP